MHILEMCVVPSLKILLLALAFISNDKECFTVHIISFPFCIKKLLMISRCHRESKMLIIVLIYTKIKKKKIPVLAGSMITFKMTFFIWICPKYGKKKHQVSL